MKISRRHVALGISASVAVGVARQAAAANIMKISHQFPGGSIEEGDFRDRLCRIFAARVEERTKGALSFDIYPNSSLMKINAQFSAMRKGALEFSLYPIAQSGGEVPACHLGLMPCLVTNYDEGAAWKNAPIGRALEKIVEEKGVKIISWIWQAGGVASRGSPIIVPQDVKSIKIRGASRYMDLMFAEAGAQISTMPSSEIYIGMQTGALDAAATSSTSLISFRIAELSKSLSTGRGHSFWFMLEPLCVSKAVFDALPAVQQKVILDVGEELESWGAAEARKDDQAVAKVYAEAGAQIVDLTSDHIEKWRRVAEASAWKEFASSSVDAAHLLKLAREIS